MINDLRGFPLFFSRQRTDNFGDNSLNLYLRGTRFEARMSCLLWFFMVLLTERFIPNAVLPILFDHIPQRSIERR